MSCAVHACKLCVILHPIVFYVENYTFYIPYLVETIIATITQLDRGHTIVTLGGSLVKGQAERICKIAL